jgi:hypothetical protein
MATVSGSGIDRFANEYASELPLRVRHFLWLSTGMFTAAALALAFLGYLWSGAFEAAASEVGASMVSGILFGVSCVLKFGPTDA